MNIGVILLFIITLFLIITSLMKIRRLMKIREGFVEYQPNIWNEPMVKNSHNCYSYFLNDIESNRVEECRKKKGKNCGQRGFTTNKEDGDTECELIKHAVIRENPDIYVINKNDKCKPNYYKGVVFSGNSKNKEKSPTYHFIRQDSNGWSHKNATDNITKLDAKGNIILNPEEANFNYSQVDYHTFCNYFCIPEKK